MIEEILSIPLIIAIFFLLREIYSLVFPTPIEVPAHITQKPKRKKLSFKEYTLEEIHECNGDNPEKPILIAIKGKVFDVTGSSFYEKGGAYHIFAGHDASKAMALQSTESTDLDKPLEDGDDMDNLDSWVQFFEAKYDVVGSLTNNSPDTIAPEQ